MTNFTTNFLIHIDRRYLALLTFQIVSNGEEVIDFRLSSSCIIQTRFYLRNHFIGLFCSVFVSSLLSLRMRPILNNFFYLWQCWIMLILTLNLKTLFPSHFSSLWFYFHLILLLLTESLFCKYIYKNISAESKSCFVSFNLR